MRSGSITLGTKRNTLVDPQPFFQNRFAKEGPFRKFIGTKLTDTYYE
jgi:hypothetical protein